MLELDYVCDLILSTPTQDNRAAHLAAASGLVHVGDYLYIVGDDENHLAIFKNNANEAGRLVRLLEGELPLEYEERKAAKGDFEVLLALPPFGNYPYGALLALGSGSKKNRRQALLLPLNAQNMIDNNPIIIDLKHLYKALKQHFEDLNIEGAFIQNNAFYLLQRGNKSADSQNALIQLDLDQVLDSISQYFSITADAIQTITPHTIGMIKEVPLCFTDAASLPNGYWVFSAAAEATDNAYADGDYLGGAIGVVNAQGDIIQLHLIDPHYKVEGVSAQLENNIVKLLLVTDADNAALPAKLLTAQLVLTFQ